MASNGGPTVLEVTADAVLVLAGGTGCPASPALVAAALDWIEDPVALLEESPVAVADLWHAVMATVVGPDCSSVVLVHPPDWPAPRVGRILAAANAFADRVVAVSRTEWPPEAGADPPEAGADTPAAGVGRRRPGRRVWAPPVAVAAVVLFVFLALPGPGPAPVGPAPVGPAPVGPAPVGPAPVGPAPVGPEPAALAEGRVEVRVPPHWTVERITGGPGSRRVQVSSPAESDVALHITQSYAPETTLAEAAEVLRRAIAGQPAGVFVDFRAEDTVAGLPAVTYREVRPGRVIRWVVLPDGATRISIGCQSPPAGAAAVQAVCDEAVRSARELGTESRR